MITEVVPAVPRAEVEDLLIRGYHPTVDISWYAPVCVLVRSEDGVLRGALTAKPGHYGKRSFSTTLRVANIILSGSIRQRIRQAVALRDGLLAWGPPHGYRVGFVVLRKSRPWFQAIRHLQARLGGALEHENKDIEVWTWRAKSS
jgi:hypothetical protein